MKRAIFKDVIIIGMAVPAVRVFAWLIQGNQWHEPSVAMAGLELGLCVCVLVYGLTMLYYDLCKS